MELVRITKFTGLGGSYWSWQIFSEHLTIFVEFGSSEVGIVSNPTCTMGTEGTGFLG